MALKNFLRPDLLNNFTPYSSAASEMGKMSDAVYLNANENPYPFEGLEGLERYSVQQPTELLSALAQNYEVKPEHLVVTRGSDESIDLLIRMFCTPMQDNILICPPTFGMYQVYAALQGADVKHVPLEEEGGSFHLDMDQIIETAQNPDNHIKLVFLPNPGAPTGIWHDQDKIRKMCTALEESCVIVMDEAYIDFTDRPSFVDILKDYPNVVVLRTMSKIHALAGERVGATVSTDSEFITFMRGCLAPYPVPKSVAANAVEALRQAEGKQDKMVADIAAQREILYNAFQDSKKVEHVYPSVGNFLLVKFRDLTTAQQFVEKCLNEKIIVRDVSTKPETQNCLRISIGAPEVNERLVKFL